MKTPIKNITAKGKAFITSNLAQWKTPAKGNYVSNKEILNYSIGGMGRDMLLMLVSYLGLGIGNTLFGSVLGIRPMHVQAMNIIVLILDIFFIGIRAMIIDNTNTKWGRFRPFIVITALPLFIIATIFMYLPFELMTYSYKLAIVFCFSLAIIIVRPYFDGSITNIGNVITPNTKERTKIIAVFAIIYSTAPTIYGFLIPILSELTGGYTDIRTYKYVMVPVAAIGVVLSMFAAFGCKERFIVPKGYKPKSNLFKSTMEVYKNKYWWIRTLSGWLAFMEWAVGNMFLWSFVYGSQDMTSYAFYNFFIGESALLAMLLTPMLLNKLGNRKLIVIQNVLNIVFLSIILITFKQPFLFFLFWFLNSLVNYFSVVYGPVFTAEINDYQHYISGKRLDGVMSFAYLIGLPITMISGLFVPALFEALGITTNYDILYEPMVRNKIFTVLVLCSMVGAILNLSPLFFYDYSHAKHRNIVKILRYRAMLADYASGDLTSQTLKDGLDGYYSYLEIINAENPDIKMLKNKLKVTKRLPKLTDIDRNHRKAEIIKIKKQLKNDKNLLLEKKEASLYTRELDKYNNSKLQYNVTLSRGVISEDINNIIKINDINHYNDKFMVAITKEEKYNKKLSIKFAKKQLTMVKLIMKNYPCGIVKPNKEEYIKACEMPHNNKHEIKERYNAIKKASLEQKRYNKTLEFYLECKRTVIECDSRLAFEQLESMYSEACKEVEENYKIAKEKELLEKQQKRTEIERLKQLRFDKFSDKKKKKILDKRRNKEANKRAEIKEDEVTKGDDNE